MGSQLSEAGCGKSRLNIMIHKHWPPNKSMDPGPWNLSNKYRSNKCLKVMGDGSFKCSPMPHPKKSWNDRHDRSDLLGFGLIRLGLCLWVCFSLGLGLLRSLRCSRRLPFGIFGQKRPAKWWCLLLKLQAYFLQSKSCGGFLVYLYCNIYKPAWNESQLQALLQPSVLLGLEKGGISSKSRHWICSR